MYWHRFAMLSVLVFATSAGAARAESAPRLKATWKEKDIRVEAFAPDGRSMVTSGGEGLRLRDAETGKVRAVLAKEPYSQPALTFSPDGRRLFAKLGSERYKPVGTSDLKVWDVATGKEFATIPYVSELDNACFQGFALSPDGKSLAFLDNSERLPMKVESAEMEFVSAVRIKATVHYNTSVGLPRVVIWDIADWKERARLDAGAPMVFSPDGATIITGSRDWHDQTARIWGAADGRPKGTFDSGSPWMKPMTFSTDGRYLALAPSEKQELYELATGRRWAVPARGASVAPLFSPDGSVLFPCGSQSIHPSFQPATGCPAYDLAPLPLKRWEFEEAPEVAMSPDGRLYAELHGDRCVEKARLLTIHDVRTRRATAWLDVDGVTGAGFSPDGRWLALHIAYYETGPGGNSLYRKMMRVVDTATARVAWAMPSPGETWGNHDWKFSPDGDTLAVIYHLGDNISRPGGPDPTDRPKTLELWDLKPR